jgi:formylglycine-generating enzyme required for sulfatase activity/class 3 adenylate cyclase
MNPGESSPPATTRRLAAILCGDIVGYSRLMGVDEEGTYARVMRYRREIIEPTVAEHHGRIVKHTGDGFLATFDSPLEAVRCAMVIQQSIFARNTGQAKNHRVQYRIGVNLGDIIIDEDDVYGDGVNIAARLQTAAEPGSVNISGGVYEQIKNKLVCGYQSLGDEKLRNITDPVRIYRVLPDPAAVERFTSAKRLGSGIAVGVILTLAAGAGGYYLLRERPFATVSSVPGDHLAPAAPPAPQAQAASPPLPGLPPPPALPPALPAIPAPATPAAPPAAAEPASSIRVTALPSPSAPSQRPAPAQNGFRDCQDCPEMINVPGGTFSMGSNDDPSEKPVRQVTIDPFAMSRFPITVGEWKACVAAQACKYEPRGEDDQPVRNLSYDDARQYAAWLSKTTSQSYRLPSEAEWEYAARAGTSTPYWWGRQLVAGMANCKGCGEPYSPEAPLRVGSFGPNAFGLHDMAGGVAQWVSDCWHKDYQGAPKDGSSWEARSCRERVLRGGSWRSADPGELKVTYRAYYDAAVRYPTHGFRVVRSPKTGG